MPLSRRRRKLQTERQKRKSISKLAATAPKSSSAPTAATRAGAVIHDDQGPTIVISRDSLKNQLVRDGPAIAASFDAICSDDIEALGEVISQVWGVLLAGLTTSVRNKNDLEQACAELLGNASNTAVAAVQLLRVGFVLQPGILVRSVLESVATALHLFLNPKDLDLYRAGRLDSAKTIREAKKVLPLLPKMYGHFSAEFAHIGVLHRSIRAIGPYTEVNAPLALNLSFLRMAFWHLYVTSELVFYNRIQSPRYWRRLNNGYAYAPSDDERAWMALFLGADPDLAP